MKLIFTLSWLLTIAFILPSVGIAQDCQKQPGRVIRLATGSEGGGYQKIGDFVRFFAQSGRLQQKGIDKIDLLESKGSAENIKLLSACSADLAVVQSDIFHEALQGHGLDDFKDRVAQLGNIRYPLYAEFIQILVPPHSTIHRVRDLNNKNIKVLIGLKNSGTASTAKTILRSAGVEKAKLVNSEDVLRPDRLRTGFKNHDYDAVFFSTAAPNPTIEALIAADAEYRLISLDNELIRDLISEGAYIAASVPSKRYWKHRWWQHSEHDEPGPPEDVATVGVEALLVSRPGYETAAAQLAGILKHQRSDFQKREGLALDLIVPYVERQSTIWLLVALVAAYVCIHLLISRYRKTLRIHQEVLVVFVFFLSIWLLAAAGLWFFEHRYNPYFDTFGKSCWSMLSYVAGRFEGRMPMTPEGEFLSILSVIFGVGLVAWFTAELSGRLVRGELGVFSRILERRNSMLHSLKDHTVIFNWDPRVVQIVKQIRQRQGRSNSSACILVTPCEVKLPEEISEHVIPLVGNTLDKDLLLKARICHAHSVVILSHWKSADADERRRLDGDAADSKTMMTIMAIRSLLNGENTQVRIIAEIRDKNNLAAARQCAGEHCEADLICIQEFGTEIIAASAATPGIAAFCSHLLDSFGAGGRIDKVVMPSELVGKSFSDALRLFNRPGIAPKQMMIPVGVYRASRMYISPSDSTLGGLLATDQLFIISEHGTAHPKPPIAVAAGHSRKLA